MKKKYVSPVIEVEQFVLTQAIANCHASMIINSTDAQCVLDSPNATDHMIDLANWGMFWTGCGDGKMTNEFNDQDGDGISDDGVCYHTGMNMAFSST